MLWWPRYLAYSTRILKELYISIRKEVYQYTTEMNNIRYIKTIHQYKIITRTATKNIVPLTAHIPHTYICSAARKYRRNTIIVLAHEWIDRMKKWPAAKMIYLFTASTIKHFVHEKMYKSVMIFDMLFTVGIVHDHIV